MHPLSGMDNLTLGYNFWRCFKKWFQLRVYAMKLKTLFVITNYSGVDPEIFGNIDNGFIKDQKYIL